MKKYYYNIKIENGTVNMGLSETKTDDSYEIIAQYHNKLDKKYFHRTLYAKNWEEQFGQKITSNHQQYDLTYHTFETAIECNNILFSNNYIPKKEQVDKILNLLYSYISLYKNKISKCYDEFCCFVYELLLVIFRELKEQKNAYANKSTKYRLSIPKGIIATIIHFLDMAKFDYLVNSYNVPFIREKDEKKQKEKIFKLFLSCDDKEIIFTNKSQENLSKSFFDEYYERTGIDLQKDHDQLVIVHDFFMTLYKYNELFRIYYSTKDEIMLKSIQFFNIIQKLNLSKNGPIESKDIEFTNAHNKLKEIYDLIEKKSFDEAYAKIKKLIKQYDKYYERNS